MKETKEMRELVKAIHTWVGKHKGRVIFHGGFVAFDKNFDVVEDKIIAYGDRECVQISIDQFINYLKKEKSEFVNW